MTQIDWSILKPVDIAGAFQQGMDAGQARRRAQVRDDALRQYGANPDGGVPNALWGADPQTAALVAGDARQRVVAARQTADALRETQGRTLGAQYIRERRPAPNALPGTAAAGGAPVDPTTGDIVVTARQPPAAPTVSDADIFQQSPEMAKMVTDHMAALSKEDREVFGHKTGVAAAVAQAATRLPLAQRAAFIDDHAPLLRQAGWTAEELAGFDPHDVNLRSMVAIGVGADKMLADDRAAAGQAITVRGQDVSAATTRRGQDIGAATARAGQAVTMRGQDIGAATARAGQAVSMRGQDMSAAAKAAPKPAQVTLAKGKLTALTALENQIGRVEAAMKKAKYRGLIGGNVPGGISAGDSAADAAVANLSPLLRQLTRVPGEGAMSDYETKLTELGKPSRYQTREAFAESLAGYRDLIAQTRAGYRDILGEVPAATASPRRGGFKVTRE